MFLPVLFFLGANWLTALLAVVLIGFNAYVLRSKRTEAMKSFMMLTAFMLTAVLMVILAFLVPWVGGLFRH